MAHAHTHTHARVMQRFCRAAWLDCVCSAADKYHWICFLNIHANTVLLLFCFFGIFRHIAAPYRGPNSHECVSKENNDFHPANVSLRTYSFSDNKRVSSSTFLCQNHLYSSAQEPQEGVKESESSGFYRNDSNCRLIFLCDLSFIVLRPFYHHVCPLPPQAHFSSHTVDQ